MYDIHTVNIRFCMYVCCVCVSECALVYVCVFGVMLRCVFNDAVLRCVVTDAVLRFVVGETVLR